MVVREKEFFRKFDTVMSGHFHHKSDDGQIYYLAHHMKFIGVIGKTQKVFTSMIQKQES